MLKTLKNRGFTLIELLVVIFIIGVLSALLMANFSSIRERSRDIQRKSDLKQIQKALELYKEDQTPYSYPQTTDWAVLKTSLEGGNYMKQVPYDPVNANGFVYSYSSPVGSDNLNYILKACLENASDKEGVSDSNCPSPQKAYILNAP